MLCSLSLEAASPPWTELQLTVPASASDRKGRLVEGDVPVTLFVPNGPGPHPLLVLNHGRNSREREERRPPRYVAVSGYFVAKGFAVALPQRLGYGASAGAGDPESMGRCADPRFDVQLAAQSAQIKAVVAALAAKPEWRIDTRRLVVAGISAGGMASLAAAADLQPMAALNFAGGLGAEPTLRSGAPCAPERLAAALRQLGKRSSQVPTMWIYADNDLRFTPQLIRDWAQAYAEAGGQVKLLQLPPHGSDGHFLFGQAPERWFAPVDAFLASLPLSTPPEPAKP